MTAEDLLRRQVRTMIRQVLRVAVIAMSAVVDSVAAGQLPRAGSERDL